jgi:hypothetical protein
MCSTESVCIQRKKGKQQSVDQIVFIFALVEAETTEQEQKRYKQVQNSLD